MNDPAAAFAPWSPAVSAVLEANLLYLEGRPSASPWAGSGRRPRLCGQTPGPAWGRERPESLKWRHEHRWIRAGVSVDLPRGFTVGGSGHLRWTDYEGDWFPHTDGRPREDLTRKLRLSVHHRKFSWKGFSPKLSLVHEVRSTNAQLYDYRRTSGEMSIVRLF